MTTWLVFVWSVFAVFFAAASAVAHSDGPSHRNAYGRLVWNSPEKERLAGWLGAVTIPTGFAGVILGLWAIAVAVTR